MMDDIAIGYEGDEQRDKAEQLAHTLNLAINNQAKNQLLVMQDKLALKIGHFMPLYVDFTSKDWQKRRDLGKKQGLVSACKPKPGLRIIDATAGWGRDAMVLASFSADVLMLENNPIMAALLNDALIRLHHSEKGNQLNLTLLETDAYDFLAQLSETEHPDIIYLDPMHPERQKTALVKKDMQILQQLIKKDDRTMALLKLAQTKTKQRVVIKWPQKLPPLLKPTLSVAGKTVRFDVYVKAPQEAIS